MTRAFIIGNGPSINQMDLTKMANDITFGCNTIYDNYENMGYHTSYYFNIDSIQPLLTIDKIMEYISNDDVISGYSLPNHSKYIYGKKIDYINTSGYKTVGMSMIWTALELQYDPIYVLGMDLDWNYPPRKDLIHINDETELDIDEKSKEMLKNCSPNWNDVYYLKSDDNSHHSDTYRRQRIPIHYVNTSDIIRAYRKNINKINKKYRDKIINVGIGGNFNFVNRENYDSLF